MINLTEERGPSHDIRTINGFEILFPGTFPLEVQLLSVKGLMKLDLRDRSGFLEVGSNIEDEDEHEQEDGDGEGEGETGSFSEVKRVAIAYAVESCLEE